MTNKEHVVKALWVKFLASRLGPARLILPLNFALALKAF